jgi:hypothetical protein
VFGGGKLLLRAKTVNVLFSLCVFIFRGRPKDRLKITDFYIGFGLIPSDQDTLSEAERYLVLAP